MKNYVSREITTPFKYIYIEFEKSVNHVIEMVFDFNTSRYLKTRVKKEKMIVDKNLERI